MGCSRFVQHGISRDASASQQPQALSFRLGFLVVLTSMVSLGALLCVAYFYEAKNRAEDQLINQRISDILARSTLERAQLEKTAMAYARGRQDGASDTALTCATRR